MGLAQSLILKAVTAEGDESGAMLCYFKLIAD